MDACRVGRAHDWRKDEQAAAIQCVAEIEKRIPTLNSRRLWDVTSQWNAIEKCTVLCRELATYCGDVANVQAPHPSCRRPLLDGETTSTTE
jgi:hypothetical protein